MLRRSNRKPKTRIGEDAAIYTELSDSEVDCGDDKDFKDQPQKRRKTQQKGRQKEGTTNKKSRKLRGSLKELINMPLDVLFEIFGHLNPADILHLARTTKELRAILMNRSAQWIWQRTRENVKDLPDCPDDLTEPQYANLAFNSLCHYCYEANTPTIIWTNRTRCCGKCLDENFSEDLYHLGDDFRGVIPTANLRTGSGRYRTRTKFCIRTFRRYQSEYNSLEFHQRKEWVAKKRTQYQAVVAHAALCERWNEGRTEDRAAELRAIRQRRYDEIERRFTEMGWGDEFKSGPPDEIFHHTLVKQPRDLTDRTWDKIMPDLLEVIQGIKRRRLETERLTAVRNRVSLLSDLRTEFVASQPLHSVVPGIGDLVRMEPFRTIIIDTPQEKTVTTTHFSHAMEELPSLIHNWRQIRDNELLALMKKAPCIGDDATVSILHLATTLFTCNACYTQSICYPQVLVHSCFIEVNYEAKRLPELLSYSIWGTQSISFRQAVYTSARSVLKTCGFNPDTTTAQEISDANPLIECLDCRHESQGRLLMRYRNAVAHSTDIHQDHRRVLADISSEDTERVMIKEKSSRSGVGTSHIACWDCVLCKMRLRLYDTRHHLLSKHQIEEDSPVESGNVVLGLDAPLRVAGCLERVLLQGEAAVV